MELLPGFVTNPKNLGPYSLRKLKICLTFESSKLEEIFKEFK